MERTVSRRGTAPDRILEVRQRVRNARSWAGSGVSPWTPPMADKVPYIQPESGNRAPYWFSVAAAARASRTRCPLRALGTA